MVSDASATKSDTPPLRVLVVEDYPDLAAATSDFLQAEGLDVRTALSGRDALELASVFEPQLVLCDLNLPDMSGFDVARALRSNASTQQTYFVVLTAMGGMNASQSGVDAFLAKPLTTEAVRALLRTVASKRP
ncbi:MAG TPA: response regulator [Vicinamibacterales bacterium]|nr:response regulator [Vicinamibacterales bacterium]